MAEQGPNPALQRLREPDCDKPSVEGTIRQSGACTRRDIAPVPGSRGWILLPCGTMPGAHCCSQLLSSCHHKGSDAPIVCVPVLLEGRAGIAKCPAKPAPCPCSWCEK